MIINRDFYIRKLLSKRENGKVKIITGIRRCGKSFLLFNLYKDLLLKEGVKENNIIEIALDRKEYIKYRNPNLLYEYIMSKINHNEQFYVFIDEIQMSYKIKNQDVDEKYIPEEDKELLYTTFYDILNDLMSFENIDVYVTGSNSKMLSKDIVTNFRDRGSEITVFPLSFTEYCSVSDMEKMDALEEYMMYGGMPLSVIEKDELEKNKYLLSLHNNVFVKDITERYNLKDDVLLSSLIDILYSSVGSLTNTHKLANTAESVMKIKSSDNTIKKYLDYLEDAFLFRSAKRYDIKGKRYFGTNLKYYATDIGLRNAKLNFRQYERSHLMENIIYNELIIKGYSVDIGIVEVTRKIEDRNVQSQHEIDFIVNNGSNKIYIQSSLNVDTEEKRQQEIFSLKRSGDFYKKIVVLYGNQKPVYDEHGILYIGIIPFIFSMENILN